MAQTAVDFLVKKFHDYGTLYYSDITEAKAMEKEQIKNSFNDGYCKGDEELSWNDIEKYYNKTYPNGL
jgi:hypothetical protein